METTNNVNQNYANNAAVVNNPAQEDEPVISLREILDMFLYNWKWFVLSVFVCCGLGYLYLKTQPKVYQRQAMMLVKEEGMSGRRSAMGTDALMQLNGVISGASVANEVYILSSYLIMKQVAKDLKFDVLYTLDGRLRDESLYDNRPFTITFEESDTMHVSVFTVKVLNEKEVRIFDCAVSDLAGVEFDETVKLGQRVNSPMGVFTIEAEPDYIADYVDKNIFVSHIDEKMATNYARSHVSTSEFSKMSSLVVLTCTDTNTKRAEDILSATLDAYRRSIVEDKNRLAQSTADFIDERIELISRELNEVESSMANYKQSNNIVDISSNAQAFLQQSSSARQRTIQLQAQRSTVRFMLDHLKSKSQGNGLIPAISGVADASIQAQITAYNTMMLERNRLVANSGDNATPIREYDTNLKEMKAAIITSMQGFLSSLDMQVRQAIGEENQLKGMLSAVPQKEKNMLDIARQQAIKETLYTYLLNKREETALQLAISEANIRIVEQPFGSDAPISPKSSIIMMGAFAMGMILPFGFLYFISLLNMGVRGRRDVENYTTIPVIGEIPHVKEGFDKTKIMVSEKSTDTLSESFRLLRFNLSFVNKNARVIMFTSTIPGEGKTFISRNFAQTLALAGKRVVLIDTDIRKRTQTALYLAKNKEGLTSYLNGTETDLTKLIVPGDDRYNVDLLPAGVRPPNPAELLMSSRFDELIEELKKTYDYIIIDNVPALVVADAGIVNRVAEMTIYVIRDRKIDRRYLTDLERLHQEKKFNNLTILLNDVHVEKRSYGYGYGNYAYSYRYGYGYGYGAGYGNPTQQRRTHSFRRRDNR